MKYIYKILTLSCLALSLGSCEKDFLDKTPPDAIPVDGFFNSAERAEQGVNAIYATLQTTELYSNTMSKLYTPPTGEVVLTNTGGYGFNDFTYSAADGILMDVYGKLYEGVFRANTVIKEVALMEDIDASLQSRLVGEAKFLRAFYYWHLTTLWGDVPLFTEPFEVPSDALVAKSTRAAIYEVMIQDLIDAEAVLPEVYGASDLGRATKGAAQALLGKVYLYDENYEQAEVWLGEVIDSELYDLVENFGDVININSENNVESVFEIQFAEVGEGDVGTLRVSYNNPQVNGGFGNNLPTQTIVDAFEDGDPRLNESIFIDGDVFAPELSTESLNLDTYQSVWSATGYNLKKGLFPVMYVNNRGTNFPAIRYADVLLMYAEAANELDMRDVARDAVNEVRDRVGMTLLDAGTTGTKEALFDAIVHERQVELAFEYHRFNDLRRWGLAQTVLGPNGYAERNRYYPLPQEEIDTNENLVQRQGW